MFALGSASAQNVNSYADLLFHKSDDGNRDYRNCLRRYRNCLRGYQNCLMVAGTANFLYISPRSAMPQIIAL